MEVKGTSLVQF